MRNKFGGNCYYCGNYVEKGQGHFEHVSKDKGIAKKWRVIHADCVFKQRKEKEDARNGLQP